MTVQPFRTEAIKRGSRMLRTALGPHVGAWLDDPAVVEIMLNPDGRLWLDRLKDCLADTGERLAPAARLPLGLARRGSGAEWRRLGRNLGLWLVNVVLSPLIVVPSIVNSSSYQFSP